MTAVAVAAVLVILLLGAWWAIRRSRRGSHAYQNQPTIPVLFEPQRRASEEEYVNLDSDWSAPSSGSDGRRLSEEMIGRIHGPPRKPEHPAPESPTRVKEAKVGSERAEPRPRPAEAEGSGDRSRGAAPERSAAAERPSRSPRVSRSSPTEFDMEDEDHTLQLLPGRMEVVAGGERGREIRFIRVPENRYTFGRRSGSEASHIQLQNATVSREHAAMRHVNGRWRIRNLSRTNPLRINGEIADTHSKEYTLQDGDRVEMGEVAFLFRGK